MQSGLLFPETHAARYGDGRRRKRLFVQKRLEQVGRDYRLGGLERDFAHQVLCKWADLEAEGKLRKRGESELESQFLTDVFGQALGYKQLAPGEARWELSPKFSVDGGTADAALGFFDASLRQPFAVIELKGPTANLDRPSGGGRTPIQQCWDYLDHLPDCPWGIVTNCVSFRLYHRDKTPRAYELFTLHDLRDRDRFNEFYAVFARGGFFPLAAGQKPRAVELLIQSERDQREVGNELYRDYQQNRVALIEHLQRGPQFKTLDQAIAIAQKLLDRIVFIAFCEDRNLLPPYSLLYAATQTTQFTRARNPYWQNFRDLFTSIDGGNQRAGITAYNGGLFAHDPTVDELELEDRWTGFFKEIGAYDFESEVNVDVLGRLFERSVTDLEQMRAAQVEPGAEPPPTVGRRKREGIYYTPPHITDFIVGQTVGRTLEERFARIAQSYDLALAVVPESKPLRRKWADAQRACLEVLRALRICDPACGSGAFLVRAFDFMEDQYEAVYARLLQVEPLDLAAEMLAARQVILRDNLFGVDLSQEAVEITQLALWLRTAKKDERLADLSQNIVRGNSLVADATVDSRSFDWQSQFARVFDEGGFDCIIGNPPYVKLQNFRKREPRAAEYLVRNYRAASTGNFDMYLPFIERSLSLLRPDGRMGFIAPNVWLFNEYGRGLRELLAENRMLETFVDFHSFQVFDDATTYTALQFFRAARHEEIQVSDARSGDLKALAYFPVSYGSRGGESWPLLDERTQRLLDKMRAVSTPLSEACEQIFQGIITSADDVYHLIRLGPGRYYSKSLEREVELEDEIMKPLVSGADAIPFATPHTDKYLLFPYVVGEAGPGLISEARMRRGFRRSWNYLRKHEAVLRRRESGKMERAGWYGYVYPKNLDKHACAKLCVPRLAIVLLAGADPDGAVYLDNVDVGGVLLKPSWSLGFVTAVLNSGACNYFWRAIAKPFRGEYRSANKQFIAPLPIPTVSDQRPLEAIANRLAELFSRDDELRRTVGRRLAVDLRPAALLRKSPLPPKIPDKLAKFDTFPMDEVLRRAERFAERKLPPAERMNWDRFLSDQADTLQTIRRSIKDARSELDELVFAAYGLTEDEISIVEEATR